MPSVLRQVGVQERRARLGRRHCLTPASLADDPTDVARSLVALHATTPSTVFLSAWARLREPRIDALERVLYEERRLVRMLGMRRTVFVVPRELVPVVHAACTQAIAAVERRRTVHLIEGAGLADDGDGGRWLEDVERQTRAALDALGEATASQLAERVPALQARIPMAQGKPYAGFLSLSTRVLFLLAADGIIVRGRPRSSWTSSQYRWAPAHTWLPGPLAEPPSVEAAQAELVRCWLGSFGPASAADLRWWTGLGAREVQRALASLRTVEVGLDGTTGVLLEDDVEPVTADAPWVALLPSLDPTPMGWKAREWFLGAHAAALFDAYGNIGPTVWSDGRIVGGWAQRATGEVVFRLLEDPGAEAGRMIEAAAARLQAWLGEVRITPGFRTPLESELSAA